MESSQKTPLRDTIWQMFDRISGQYDGLNRLLSLRQDVRWRKKLAEFLPQNQPLRILDVATGTADVPIFLLKKLPVVEKIVGIDPAQKMMAIGRKKIARKGLNSVVTLLPGNAMQLPFSDGVFDAVTISFGIRNVTDIRKALQEMQRVLKPGGRVLILEFSLPINPFFRKIYLFYFRRLLPGIGGILSGAPGAYRYLNTSVETFPYGEDFLKLLEASGFRRTKVMPLTLGIATIYSGKK